jgi:uncharacterized protein (TIGR02145 family)
MKATGNIYWNPPNAGATNSSGFNGLPGGMRDITWGMLREEGIFWINLEVNSTQAKALYLRASDSQVLIATSSKLVGYSVRCLQD